MYSEGDACLDRCVELEAAPSALIVVKEDVVQRTLQLPQRPDVVLRSIEVKKAAGGVETDERSYRNLVVAP
jgi:hypothetical protein